MPPSSTSDKDATKNQKDGKKDIKKEINAPPPPPPITNVVATNVGATQFNITWVGGSGNPSDFFFTLNDVATVPSSASATTATFTNLVGGTVYSVVVICSTLGGTEESAPIPVLTLLPGPQPAVTAITQLQVTSTTGDYALFSYLGGLNATAFSFLLSGNDYTQISFEPSLPVVQLPLVD